MTSYRSKAAAWAKGDKVNSTHFETVEDNADTALQLHDFTTPIHPSVSTGGAYVVVQQIEDTVASTRIQACGATVELDFGTCQTGDILMANASFYSYTGNTGCYYWLDIAASGTTNRIQTIGVTSASTHVISLTGTWAVVSAGNNVRHFAGLHAENTDSAGTTAIRGDIGITGFKWRPTS
jgi:hypothetical protein